jgi:hypothetical protein
MAPAPTGVLARLSRSSLLRVPLPPTEALARLEVELRQGAELRGAVAGETFVVRCTTGLSGGSSRGNPVYAVARGRVASEGTGSLVTFTLTPAMLDAPPLAPMVLLSVAGAAAALLGGEPGMLALLPLLWAVPLAVALLCQPLLGWEAGRIRRHLEQTLR